MTTVTVLGDPERLAAFLDGLVLGGNDIRSLRLTRNKATYIVVFESSGPLSFLLREDGSFLLLENGDKIIL